MGITAAAEKDYSGAVRALFPEGDYWDSQFADPESDLSLFCRAKTQEIIRFRKRMRDLYQESDYRTAVQTMDDWERVLLDYTNNQLPLEERRNIISAQKNSVINRIIIANIAQIHGLVLVDIVFPFKPSFFGFSQFGRSIFSRPVFFSVFYIIAAIHGEAARNEAKGRINRLSDNASFGRSRFGIGLFLGRFYFNKHYASRIFRGIKELDDFEQDVGGKLLANSITYFQYRL